MDSRGATILREKDDNILVVGEVGNDVWLVLHTKKLSPVSETKYRAPALPLFFPTWRVFPTSFLDNAEESVGVGLVPLNCDDITLMMVVSVDK